MRTVILLLGIMFHGLLSQHWGIPFEASDTIIGFTAFVLIGCIILDIIKK